VSIQGVAGHFWYGCAAKPGLTPRFAVRLLVLFDAQGASCVPMTEYVAALQARALPHWLSCATDEHL
jgi:hypothetical protein